ncbi:MAG: hypothetical protein KGJ57_15065 [Sphingomonadales bacterium]|nr:hypothetical protein [Sphingomonadales bacterium]MDE2170724.1 hypothetical protein [Sphingomonadales bacterium]
MGSMDPWRATRRWLFLIHRWVGIASGLLFAMWFASGLVMICVSYPSPSPAQRLAGAPAIDWAAVHMPPPGGRLRSAVLELRDGLPVWRITNADGGQSTLPARRGATLAPIDAAILRQDNAAWLQIDPQTGAVLERLDSRRLYRWLFDLLHKWGANARTARLTQRKPMRRVEVSMISRCIKAID